MTWKPSTADLLLAGASHAPPDCTQLQAITASIAEALHGHYVGHSGKGLGRMAVALGDADAADGSSFLLLHVTLPGMRDPVKVHLNLEIVEKERS